MASRGEIPAYEAIADGELVRLRKAVETARDHADKEEEAGRSSRSGYRLDTAIPASVLATSEGARD
jgi:hypothetical protein